MNEDRIADRIERVSPLLLHSLNAIEKTYVFHHRAEEIGDIYEVADFILMEPLAGGCANLQHTDRAFLPAERNSNQLGDACFGHAAAYFRVFFRFKTADAVWFLRDFGIPSPGKNVMFQVAIGEADGSAHDKFLYVALPLEQANHSVTGIHAANNLAENLLK